MNNRLSKPGRMLLAIAGLLMIATYFLPLWQIQLTAPQYPEGLKLEIWLNRLGADVEVINGLNHYIGMGTLHEKDFAEFTYLQYIVAGLILTALAAALLNRRKWLFLWMLIFLAVAALGLYDFWKWEYEYGHNLDPTAPIQVPGMAYQPPLIGFKQLLNFGAYSIPDTGGWFYAASGFIGAALSFFEFRNMRKEKKA